MKKAALHNLGCKVNAYETEAMQKMLEDAGYEIVSFPEFADVYVINTCSVTNMADRKSRQMLHRCKKMNPDAVVVGAGCYIQTKEQEAMEDSAIDILIGNNQKHELVAKIEEFLGKKEKTVDVIDINDGVVDYESLCLSETAEHTRAFIKVQDGCNQFCSYCIIPYARGRVRSRNCKEVVEEITNLAKKGYKEVVLTGIHLSSYGCDCDDNLLHLIQEVHNIEGIKRIRLGSMEPRLITDEFASQLASLEKICPHFHLSLQSGCDETLKRMNRKYTTDEFEMGCQILRKYFHNPAITTDVIVGFPGETKEEFETTKAFLERIHFYEMHIFQYSKRQGTRAAVMPNQVLEADKKKRSEILLALEEEMSKEYRDNVVGTMQEVLFEEEVEINNEKYFVGYTKEYIKIATKTNENLENQIREGKIVGALSKDIYLLQ